MTFNPYIGCTWMERQRSHFIAEMCLTYPLCYSITTQRLDLDAIFNAIYNFCNETLIFDLPIWPWTEGQRTNLISDMWSPCPLSYLTSIHSNSLYPILKKIEHLLVWLWMQSYSISAFWRWGRAKLFGHTSQTIQVTAINNDSF